MRGDLDFEGDLIRSHVVTTDSVGQERLDQDLETPPSPSDGSGALQSWLDRQALRCGEHPAVRLDRRYNTCTPGIYEGEHDTLRGRVERKLSAAFQSLHLARRLHSGGRVRVGRIPALLCSTGSPRDRYRVVEGSTPVRDDAAPTNRSRCACLPPAVSRRGALDPPRSTSSSKPRSHCTWLYPWRSSRLATGPLLGPNRWAGYVTSWTTWNHEWMATSLACGAIAQHRAAVCHATGDRGAQRIGQEESRAQGQEGDRAGRARRDTGGAIAACARAAGAEVILEKRTASSERRQAPLTWKVKTRSSGWRNSSTARTSWCCSARPPRTPAASMR